MFLPLRKTQWSPERPHPTPQYPSLLIGILEDGLENQSSHAGNKDKTAQGGGIGQKSEGRGEGREKGKLGVNELGERCRGGVCHLGQEWRELGQGRCREEQRPSARDGKKNQQDNGRRLRTEE